MHSRNQYIDMVMVTEGMPAKMDGESRRWGRTKQSKGNQSFFRGVESWRKKAYVLRKFDPNDTIE